MQTMTTTAPTTTEIAAAKLVKATLEQAGLEAGSLADDLDNAVQLMNQSREELAAYGRAMPVEVARNLIVAIRAARKAVCLVNTAMAVDFPEEAGE